MNKSISQIYIFHFPRIKSNTVKIIYKKILKKREINIFKMIMTKYKDNIAYMITLVIYPQKRKNKILIFGFRNVEDVFPTLP